MTVLNRSIEVTPVVLQALQELSALKDRLERERLETEARYRAQNDKLQERNADLDKQVRSLLDTKYALETRLAELNGKLNTVEDDLQQKHKVKLSKHHRLVVIALPRACTKVCVLVEACLPGLTAMAWRSALVALLGACSQVDIFLPSPVPFQTLVFC